MKFIKKAMLLAVAAVAAAALAAPATASAVEWTRNGSPLTENATATFQGPLTFSNKLFSISCTVTVGSTLKPGSAGTVNSFGASFPTCILTGVLSKCKPTSLLSPSALPWGLSAESSSEIGVSGIHLGSNFLTEGSCSVKELTFEGNLVAFPNSSSEITSIAFNEKSGSLSTNFMGVKVTASGTLNASFEPAGAYGIK